MKDSESVTMETVQSIQQTILALHKVSIYQTYTRLLMCHCVHREGSCTSNSDTWTHILTCELLELQKIDKGNRCFSFDIIITRIINAVQFFDSRCFL